jgi:hypothetical protein
MQLMEALRRDFRRCTHHQIFGHAFIGNMRRFSSSQTDITMRSMLRHAAILQVSARSGQGMTDWYDWLRSQLASAQQSAFA